MKLYLYLIFIVVCTVSYAQNNNSKGNLIHVNVNQNSIDYTDTLGFWQYGINDMYSSYYDIVLTESSMFLLRSNNYSPEQRIGFHAKEIENIQTGERREFSYFDALDYIGLCDFQPNTYRILKGVWLFDDVLGNGFLSNSDTLYKKDLSTGNYLYHICGEIDSSQMVLWNDNYSIKYFKIDLNDSPTIDTLQGKRLNFSSQDKIVHIEKFEENYYFVQMENDLNLYVFEADSFRYVKTVLQNKYYQNFIFRGNKLYAWDNGSLFKYNLSLIDTIFSEETKLLEGDIFVDYLFNYAVKIDLNELQFFNIDSETIEKTWDLEISNYCFKPIICYPDIYFHNTTDITSILDSELYTSNSSSLNIYPNPFNASITFRFKNTSNKNTSLKIYNLTGTLIDKINFSHTDHFVWMPKNIASGIYFTVVNDGINVFFNKIHYLK